MEKEELLYTLALQRAKGIGDVNAKKLIKHCGSAKNVFRETRNSLLKIEGIGLYLAREISNSKNLVSAEKEIKKIEEHHIKIHYYFDKEYPENLRNCTDAPVLLFQDGDFNVDNSKIISIVGTRNMTSYGKDFCEGFIEELSVYNPVIVSGFAYGVDICAHKAAIKNNLQTVGVFAHGFGHLYPKAHKKYMADVYNNGGFLTDFWFDDTPIRENFLKRNRIVAGISEATIVVESAEKGGALVTADIANSYSRDVYALPGRSTDLYSKGCNALIKDCKAGLITSAEDLVQMLGWKKTVPKTSVQPQLFVELDGDEQKVFDFLKGKEQEQLDVIAFECSIPVYKMASVLVQLEMKGLVKPLPGKEFKALG
jgi:DNA processing protein